MDKLVDKYSNTHHHYTGKKPFDADYSALTEEIESSQKPTTFEIGDRVRIAKYKNIFSKGYTKNWSIEIYVIDSALKTNPWTNNIKNLNGKALIGSFFEKELLLSFKLLLLLNYNWVIIQNQAVTLKIKSK